MRSTSGSLVAVLALIGLICVVVIVAPRGRRESVSVEGRLDGQTAPFRLDGGSYAVSWQVTAWPGGGGCAAYLTLHPADSPAARTSLASTIDSNLVASGAFQLERLKAGQYYVEVGSTCQRWSVSFSPA
jgi:hypothetical protein